MALINKVKTRFRKIIPRFVIDWYHFAWAFLAAVIYRFPSRKIKVIGITGTNGKSTTVLMVAKILEQAGFNVAVSSSIEFSVAGKAWKNQSRMTMPGRLALQKLLRAAVSQGCQYAVVEVSSEGIKQHRHRFIDFAAVAFTNVTPEHIESHGSFENYLAAKGGLFSACRKIHILNGDDENCEFFAKFLAKEKYVYSLKKNNCYLENAKTVRPRVFEIKPERSSFEINGVKFDLPLRGEFNVYNALAAISLALSQEIGLEVCCTALAKIAPAPGRMEKVFSGSFDVFVDYAVTPDSLEKAYQAAKNGLGQGRLICVLGACGGGRDKWKRPVMGELAKKYCDRAIITNEDPYDEDPQAIIDQVVGGQKEAGSVEKIVDRRQAVARALEIAQSGDRVIITGKGCEDSMCLAGGKKVPWSDEAAVLEEVGRQKLK
jgi:UDP-N-acetylmuramoyl-L-alanyl-D-glutamate--2,6-diaminopimelate ligase